MTFLTWKIIFHHTCDSWHNSNEIKPHNLSLLIHYHTKFFQKKVQWGKPERGVSSSSSDCRGPAANFCPGGLEQVNTSMISTTPDIFHSKPCVFERGEIRNPMTLISFDNPITCVPSPCSRAPFTATGHASTGSDERGHERDERLVRKYNKEVDVYCVWKITTA